MSPTEGYFVKWLVNSSPWKLPPWQPVLRLSCSQSFPFVQKAMCPAPGDECRRSRPITTGLVPFPWEACGSQVTHSWAIRGSCLGVSRKAFFRYKVARHQRKAFCFLLSLLPGKLSCEDHDFGGPAAILWLRGRRSSQRMAKSRLEYGNLSSSLLFFLSF